MNYREDQPHETKLRVEFQHMMMSLVDEGDKGHRTGATVTLFSCSCCDFVVCL